MNRRDFLHVASAGAIAAATAACAPDARYDADALARPELLAALGPDATRAIGRRYLAMNSYGMDARSLRRAILASRPWSDRLFGQSPSVSKLVNTDFSDGRTVVVDGWILSVTEARQCALLALRKA
jgi:hypothetical protein